MRYTLYLLVFSLILPALSFGNVKEDYDLVIYGGSSAAVAAAVQAKKMGKSVVIIEPVNSRVGGLTTGGLGQTDIGNKQVIGGISRDFYRAVRAFYRNPEAWKWQPMPADGKFRGMGQAQTDPNEETMWTFAPSTALTIYEKWLKENDIPVVYGEKLNRKGEAKSKDRGDGFWVAAPGTVAEGVIKDGNRITEIVMESGRRFGGKMFMDATYEGDLMASSGVAFTKGREGEAIYGESVNGVRAKLGRHHQLTDGVDPYVVPGDPASGLLPGIEASGVLEEGASDHRIQAYCFRMCLTNVDANRIPFEKPADYDELTYELMFRNYEAGSYDIPRSVGAVGGRPWINGLMPDGKTDTNNRTGFSTDFIGQNHEWPEGSYEERAGIREKHLSYQKGLMWALANHPRVPQAVRDEVSKWGMTKDEFVEGDGWQEQLYVREGRRMISDFIMTQQHCQQLEPVEDSVGMGAYAMDSHHVRRYVNENGHVKNEGDVQSHLGGRPYPISYRSIVPQEAEVANLVVPIALSASHMAFGSIRMEPVFMVLGQSGATAAALAIDEGTSLQNLDYARLRERLVADGQVLEHESSKPQQKPAAKLDGIIVDDADAVKTGSWKLSAVSAGVGKGYHHDGRARDGKSIAVFKTTLPQAGKYDVQLAYVAGGNRATNVPVTIATAQGDKTVTVNQKQKPRIDGHFVSLGKFDLGKETSVTVGNKGADGHVVIDAVRWVPVK